MDPRAPAFGHLTIWRCDAFEWCGTVPVGSSGADHHTQDAGGLRPIGRAEG